MKNILTINIYNHKIKNLFKSHVGDFIIVKITCFELLHIFDQGD